MGPETDKKVGFLKGLLEHYHTDDEIQAKLLGGIVDVLEELTARVDILDDDLNDLNDYVESIDDDLASIEEDIDEDGFPFPDEDDEGEDGDAPPMLRVLDRERRGSVPDDEEDGDDEDDLPRLNYICVICPECRRCFLVEITPFESLESEDEGLKFTCPHCGKAVEPMPPRPGDLPVGELV